MVREVWAGGSDRRSEMTGNLRIRGDRLWASLMEMARIGATPKGGVNRISFTEEDGQARRLFAQWCEEIGCPVRVDAFGNMFARRRGRDSGLAPVLVGSHLDSQPTGGKFDGAYGVLSALEILRTLTDTGFETERPIEVVNWTNEEGSIFKPMMGSEVYSGALALETAYAMLDPDGRTLESGLDRIGYKGDSGLMPYPVHCYFEAHIEQGPILEREGIAVGIVTGAFAQRWYALTLIGLEAHAGPTPMEVRRDALMGAAEVALAAREIAREAKGGRATIGRLTLYPASPNVIPGRVDLTIDFRHETDTGVIGMDAGLRAAVARIASSNGLDADLRETVSVDHVPFHPTLIGYVREAANALGESALEIVSGAGHDACNMARIVPTTMVFIPCENGISHNESENATPGDCEAGCNVLLHAVIRAANDTGELAMAR
jgi:N-carbamoyl-L-amino-acid hydrolase